MANRVVMPKLTDTMEEGVLRKWHKKEGEFIESGDPIAEVETDKAIMDLEAFASGFLRKILVSEGAVVPSGELIAIIAREDESIDDILAEITCKTTGEKAGYQEETTVLPHAIEIVPVVEKGAVWISPLARRMAEESGIDIATIRGSGPGGRITQRDVEQMIAGRGVTTSALPDQPAGGLSSLPPLGLSMFRKAVAKRMMESKGPVPHFYVVAEIDMEKAIAFKDKMKADVAKLTFTEIFLKATALTLRKFPAYRSSYQGDSVLVAERVDVGFAVGIPDGVITPVITDCDQKTLSALSEEVRDKINRAQEKKLAPSEYTGAIFSISNLGMYRSVESFSAIITPPESGVLAIGSVVEKPVVRNHAVAIGKRVKMTLSTDHRVADGVLAAQFLSELTEILQNPERLSY
jgi:pyruvate dehydrogenase E2 component (dihydrolipoamide acetyltransferase)